MSQADRDAAKLTELRRAGESISLRTWQRRRAAYRELGVASLLDARRGRPRGSTTADPRGLTTMSAGIDARAEDSTRTKDWIVDKSTLGFPKLAR